MSASLFVIGPDNGLTSMVRTEYESEDLLQRLLADHPSVLGVASRGSGDLLLVRRELGVPDDEGGSGRWSLDHLFIDREAVPVLVEVKRASDTRARREVVAQMLDYAANGVAYWPMERLLEAFRESCAADDGDPEPILRSFLGEEADPESFWRQVEANLRSGRIRMVFVADRIPKELRRIVEFLNEQMRPAEVLAVEVEQYAHADGLRILSPKLVGATERARTAKAVAAPVERESEDDWLARLGAEKGEAALNGARRAVAWFREQGLKVGVSSKGDSIYAQRDLVHGRETWPFFVRRSTGRLEVSLGNLKNCPGFEGDETRQAILERLRGIPGLTITTQKVTGWPGVPLADVLREEVWEAWRDVASGILAKLGERAAA